MIDQPATECETRRSRWSIVVILMLLALLAWPICMRAAGRDVLGAAIHSDKSAHEEHEPARTAVTPSNEGEAAGRGDPGTIDREEWNVRSGSWNVKTGRWDVTAPRENGKPQTK